MGIKKTILSGKVTGDKIEGKAAIECIQQQTVLEVQWTNCPVEVEEDVRKLWLEYELSNDHCYIQWDSGSMRKDYPVLAEYLKSRGVKDCLIHWWW